jgi:hypothetical protein
VKLRSVSDAGEVEEVSEEELRNRATMIVCNFILRVTLAWKKKRAQEEAARLLEDWAAMKFQSCWRNRKARRRVLEIKEERDRMNQEVSALKVEALWRTFQAKKALKMRQQDKEITQAAACITRNWKARAGMVNFGKKKKAAALLARLARRQIDGNRAAAMRKEMGGVPFRVKLVAARGLGGGGGGGGGVSGGSGESGAAALLYSRRRLCPPTAFAATTQSSTTTPSASPSAHVPAQPVADQDDLLGLHRLLHEVHQRPVERLGLQQLVPHCLIVPGQV